MKVTWLRDGGPTLQILSARTRLQDVERDIVKLLGYLGGGLEGKRVKGRKKVPLHAGDEPQQERGGGGEGVVYSCGIRGAA